MLWWESCFRDWNRPEQTSLQIEISSESICPSSNGFRLRTRLINWAMKNDEVNYFSVSLDLRVSNALFIHGSGRDFGVDASHRSSSERRTWSRICFGSPCWALPSICVLCVVVRCVSCQKTLISSMKIHLFLRWQIFATKRKSAWPNSCAEILSWSTFCRFRQWYFHRQKKVSRRLLQ